MRKLNIAIIGLGNIGSYLFQYLKKNKRIISKKNNCIPNVIHISAKNKKKNRGFKINKKIWLNDYLDATKIKNVDLQFNVNKLKKDMNSKTNNLLSKTFGK